MKDSGIEWIGIIPEKWEIKKIKFLPNDKKDSFIDGDWIDSQYIEENGIRYYTTGNIGDGNFKEQGTGFISKDTFIKLKCKFAYPGDLIFSRLNAPYGRSCILPNKESRCIIAVDNVILRTDNNKQYICYVTQCEGYHDAVGDFSNGATMQRISRINLGNVIIPLPEIKEQKLIADFLDDKVEKIDDILNDLNKQVVILEKYKKLLITETVTKGLNPNVEMKDSEIEWIGKIPKNWKITKLKYVAKLVNGDRGSNYPSGEDMVNEGVLFVTSNNIHGEKLDNAPEISKYITIERYNILGGAKIELGDIIFCLRGSVGMCALNDKEDKGTIASSLVDIKPNKINSYYLNYFLQSEVSQHQTNLYTNGSCAANLSAENVLGYYCIEPTQNEQQKIVEFLTEKCTQIDEIIKDKQTQIDKMEKYKKSLIYEYVTGKKRVKGAEELYV